MLESADPASTNERTDKKELDLPPPWAGVDMAEVWRLSARRAATSRVLTCRPMPWSGESLRLVAALASAAGCVACSAQAPESPTRRAHPGAVDLAAPAVTRGLRIVGRATLDDPARNAFSWSGAGFEVRFHGTGVAAELWSDVDGLVHGLRVDGAAREPIVTTRTRQRVVLAAGLAPAEHRVLITRETEGQMGTSTLGALSIEGGALLPPARQPRPLIEVVGDSISAGYGILGTDQHCPYSYATQRFSLTYGALSAAALGGEAVGIAISGHGVFQNLDGTRALLLAEAYERTLTSTPTPAWLGQPHPDVVVVNLGTNDYGVPGGDPSLGYRVAYLELLSRLRALHPDALIVAALGSMVSDDTEPRLLRWRDAVAAVVAAREAAGDPHLVSVEFPLDTMDELGCDWHPNAAKHARMADQLTRVLEDAGVARAQARENRQR